MTLYMWFHTDLFFSFFLSLKYVSRVSRCSISRTEAAIPPKNCPPMGGISNSRGIRTGFMVWGLADRENVKYKYINASSSSSTVI